MGVIRELQRAQARQVRAQRQAQTAYHRHQQQMHREAVRAAKAAEQASKYDERERKRLYLEARAAEAAADNSDTQSRIAELEDLLSSTLAVDDHIDFAALKETAKRAPFDPKHLGVPLPPPQWAQFAPPELAGLGKLLGKGKYQQQRAAAEAEYGQACAQHAAAEAERQRQLAAYRREYDEWCKKDDARIAAGNAEIDAFAAAFSAGDPNSIVAYFGMVLGKSVYPDDFPQRYRLAYVPESRQLVVEYGLPPLDVIPTVREYRYVKARNEITAAPRTAKDIRERYTSVVTQVTLRTIHELFEADRTSLVDVVVFNGIVDTIDPRTGQPIEPCLVTLRTTRDVFTAINLGNVDPASCLQHLNASVSKRPEELAPVRPVLEFDMVDKRFIDEVDVLADLDQRQNLLKLTPSEFESLIQNLFAKMGLDTKQTRASRDGGVDCVAFDPRPIFGGKVVIQAKRYRHTVDVSAVRDLFGTLQNEGASKGILVTTSGYGPTAYEFASGKPMELIDGSNLLYLLAEHAGINARIDASELD
jgi:restriction system protein